MARIQPIRMMAASLRRSVPSRDIQVHLVRDLLGRFLTGQGIETAGDSFLIVFSTPSDVVRFGPLNDGNLGVLHK